MCRKIILASNSPRRKEILARLDMPFVVRVAFDVDENYPDDLRASAVAQFLATKKAEANVAALADDELLITADTIVVVDDEVLGKPMDEADARRMLQLISGRSHQVITGVCMIAKEKVGERNGSVCRRSAFSVSTDVTFRELTSEEIDYYISKYAPMDKAGAYGIQEWIGYVGVTEIRGSFFNVMGLPIQRIYCELKKFGVTNRGNANLQ